MRPTYTTECSVDGCDRVIVNVKNQWCSYHYASWQRYGDHLRAKRRIKLPCSIDGCAKTAVTRGWCPMHYCRWQRHGDPLTVKKELSPKIYGDPFFRVMDRTLVGDGCWEYQGKTRVRGRGRDSSGPLAYRIVYERMVGPSPPGLELHHICENPLCVRPDHLTPLSTTAHGREHRRERCPNCGGTDFLEPRQGPNSATGRRCRECQRRRQRKWEREREQRTKA